MPLTEGIDADQREKTRRMRRSHEKSKRGCVTCKIRRKKCDELKPSCLRCTSTGRTCDGYEDSDIKRTVKRRNSPTSISNVAESAASTNSFSTVTKICTPQVNKIKRFRDLRCAKGQSSTTLSKHPSTFPVEADLDWHFFEYFYCKTGPQFSSYYDCCFWQNTVFPSCFANATVRHATLALGAIHRSHALPRSFAREQCTNSAIKYYTKALRLLQRELQGTDALEACMVTPKLLAAFETFQGNFDTAATHLSNGLKIVFSKRRRNLSLDTTLKIPNLTGKTLRDLIFKIEKCVTELLDRAPSLEFDTVPAPFKSLEDAFDRLYTQVHVLLQLLNKQREIIDYQYHSERLVQWSITFAEFLESSRPSCSTCQRSIRFIRIYHEAAFLLLLTQLRRSSATAEPTAMSDMECRVKLNAQFSKLYMLVGNLLKDPSYVTHLSPGKLHDFRVSSGLVPKPCLQNDNGGWIEHGVYSVAEKLVSIETAAARTCGLTNAHTMWADLTSLIERKRMSIRYCTPGPAGDLVWSEQFVDL